MKRTRKADRKQLLAMVEAIADQPDATDVVQHLNDAGFAVAQGVADSFKAMLVKLGQADEIHENLSTILLDLRESPDPSSALLNFLRYVDTTGTPIVLLSSVARAKPLREMLATVFGTSQYMSDIIIRNPGYLFWLVEKRTWEREESKDDYLTDLRSDTVNFRSVDGKLNAIRRFHRRSLLKIGVKDLLGLHSIEETTRSLSRLADAVTDGILEIQFDDKFGKPNQQSGQIGFAVIALGKLGGCELNFSSDIDLIYVCDDADDTTIDRYVKLARSLTSSLSEVTAEGYLYRVDLRLRPDGDVGPLVNPISAMMVYYENRARPWEFQAMLKARVIAGDVEVGERFLDQMSALVFSPTLSYSPLETIALMRHRIRENISTRDRAFNIKLMEGGIRDIEFFIQAIQLLHGGKHNDLRSSNTVSGIEAAYARKLLKRVEHKTLINAYRFFRLVEHRLQMIHQRQTHSIPESNAEIDFLAHRVSRGPLGRFAPDAFLSTLASHISKVRVLSDGFFESQEVPDSVEWLLFPEDEAVTEEVLSRYNFSDTRHALGVLQSLGHGTFPHLVDRRTRESFQKLLPVFLEGVSVTGNPNQTLINFAAIVGATKSPGTFYELLLESLPFRTLVRDIVGSSSLLTRKLAANFSIIDLIRDDPKAVIKSRSTDSSLWRAIMTDKRGDRSVSAYKTISDTRDRSTVAAWVTDINSGTFPVTMAHTLAYSTRDIISKACEVIFGGQTDVSVFALGSFGVSEPRLTSDLDLLVVAAGGDLEPVTRAVQTLGRIVARANLFKLDFRLRGEGENAPLVQDVEYYRQYFAKRISPWERVAFTKCSLWYGDSSVSDEFVSILIPCLTKPPDHSSIKTLIDTREKLEHLVPEDASTLETKRSQGARYDIDYLCALGLAVRGIPFQLGGSSVERLGWVLEAGLLSKGQHRLLVDALTLYNRVEYLLDLAGMVLPKTEEKSHEIIDYLDRTMELLGLAVDGGVRHALTAHKTEVREIYNEFMNKAAGK